MSAILPARCDHDHGAPGRRSGDGARRIPDDHRLRTRPAGRGRGSDGTEAVALARQLDPDIVLMDIRMPGVDGIEATRRLMRAGADLGPHADDLRPRRACLDSLPSGASGFLLKNAPPEQLVAAIRTVAAGDALLAPQITRRIIEQYVSWPRAGDAVQGPFRDLSERELDVLRLIARGLSNAEIASTLFVSQGTVKTHVTRILTRSGSATGSRRRCSRMRQVSSGQEPPIAHPVISPAELPGPGRNPRLPGPGGGDLPVSSLPAQRAGQAAGVAGVAPGLERVPG